MTGSFRARCNSCSRGQKKPLLLLSSFLLRQLEKQSGRQCRLNARCRATTKNRGNTRDGSDTVEYCLGNPVTCRRISWSHGRRGASPNKPLHQGKIQRIRCSSTKNPNKEGVSKVFGKAPKAIAVRVLRHWH
ncbi:unnamed protein product [Ixodes pacificus]